MRACNDGRVRSEDEGDEPGLVEEAEDAEHRQRRREDVDAARGRHLAIGGLQRDGHHEWSGQVARRTQTKQKPRFKRKPRAERIFF